LDLFADARSQDAGRPPALLASIFVDRHIQLYCIRCHRGFHGKLTSLNDCETARAIVRALDCGGGVGILVSVEMNVAVDRLFRVAGMRRARIAAVVLR
ncbi:hypothetical protein, partial [Candidatus Binatus sp.]|uniref:hypothetical protein n=1 Tax=Candidatus Binatus sp. TaxID=2811406 RepID=UPI003C5E19EF